MSQTVTLGILSPYFGGEYLGEVVAQIYHSAQAHNVRVIAIRTGEIGRFDMPIAWNHVDAWIIVLNAVTPAFLAQLVATGKPIASIAHRFDDPNIVSVESDNEGSTALVVSEMIRAGHRHIAYIGYLSQYDIGRRLAGYYQALTEHGIPLRPEYVLDTADYGQAGGSLIAAEILQRQLPVTAVFAGTDRNAVGAMTAFQENGLRVPEDIAVVGYDNTYVARTCVPPLASIDQNLNQVADRAVVVLLDQLQSRRRHGGRELVANTFVLRQSCGLDSLTESATWRHETPEMVTDKDLTTTYEIGRHLAYASPESIESLMKLLVPYVGWRCVGRWDDPVEKPDAITIRNTLTYSDDRIDRREIPCELMSFPPLEEMGKTAEFDSKHFICLLPIVPGNKRLRMVAVSGLIGSTRRLAGTVQYIDLLGPAFERTALDEELAAYQAGLEDLVRQRTAELQQKTAELGAERDRAESANRAKSSFLASMSHELRTPLNGILGYAQILKRDKNLSDHQLGGLDTIERSGEHLLTLINDILDLAKIEAGKFELYPDALNLHSFLRIIVDIIGVKVEQKGLFFAHESSANLPRVVQADERRLREILLNLLGNAVKFTSRGQVGLQVRVLSEKEGEALIRFEVQDTGVGISEAQLERIFQPFEQAGDVQQRLGGTGLGLAISRELIRLMGSDIHVESKPDEGSRFWFDLRLPVVQAEVIVETPSEQLVIGYQGKRMKVLVVDDVIGNRAVVNDFLGSLGFEMYEAENGLEGVAQAQAHIPDLILMDNVMPVMSGGEAMHRLREIPYLKNIPIVAVSASAFDTDLARSLAVGANAFLPKPVNLTSLLRLVGSLLHLIWIYEKPEEHISGDIINIDASVVLPPSNELETLHQLAMTGNMRDIREQADYLATLDERYVPFAEKLRLLAEGYHSDSILKMVEKYMDISS